MNTTTTTSNKKKFAVEIAAFRENCYVTYYPAATLEEAHQILDREKATIRRLTKQLKVIGNYPEVANIRIRPEHVEDEDFPKIWEWEVL